MRRCRLVDCVLDHADLGRLVEERSRIRGCYFCQTGLEGALLGIGGSQYRDCTFVMADLSWAQLVQPRLRRCVLDRCVLDGRDLSSASLIQCSFAGKLVGVRLGNPSPGSPSLLGRGRQVGNRTHRLDLSRARLEDVTFVGGCPLSSFVLAPHHRFFDHWRRRLALAVRHAGRHQGSSWDHAIEYLRGLQAVADKQQHWILDVRDLWTRLGFKETEQVLKLLSDPPAGPITARLRRA
jgi:hypothetical protein